MKLMNKIIRLKKERSINLKFHSVFEEEKTFHNKFYYGNS